MDDSSLFSPTTERWTPLCRSYLTMRRVLAAIGWTLLVAPVVAVVAWFFPGPWAWATAVVGLGVIVWRVERLGRWFRRWGYAERADDLYITSGLWWRSLTIIPYGRMQVVHVHAGPVDRLFGVSSVQLVTASPESNARIPGLATSEAERLRDRLSERGESRSAGL